MAKNIKWNSDKTMKFIQCYKRHECLWHFSSADYKNKQKRDAALIAIVNQMNIDDFGVPEVKNKIKNLRSTYSQELKKAKDSKKSGVGLKRVYISNIKWLKEMEEVFHSKLKRKKYENIQGSQFQEQVEQESGSQCIAATAKTTTATYTNNSTVTASRPKKRSRKIVKAINHSKTLHDNVNVKEETAFDVYGKSVAMQLKNLSLENALMAQKKIQCILTEIGIADYREKTGNISSLTNYSYQSVQTPASSPNFSPKIKRCSHAFNTSQ